MLNQEFNDEQKRLLDKFMKEAADSAKLVDGIASFIDNGHVIISAHNGTQPENIRNIASFRISLGFAKTLKNSLAVACTRLELPGAGSLN